ncbi:MAG: hypothetical protein FJ265_19350 [Planctomycetes bacterium]|nr:hypothetical protein [Planctomycetota bacterium]
MDALRGLPAVPGVVPVQERNPGGNKANAEAFRRALQQQGGEDEATDRPVRPALQPRPGIGRKDGAATSHHVDVLA